MGKLTATKKAISEAVPAAIGLGAATQGEDAAAYASDPVLSGLSAGTTAYMQEAEQRKGRWDDLREDLLNAVDQGLQAIDMPWRGYLGLSRLAGGLVAGEGFDQALNAGAMQARQPLEQTAYELGGEVTDATGSPALGTAVNVGVNIGGPM